RNGFFTRKNYFYEKGSITSIQAVYVPADDLTYPAPATTFAHLDATTVLSTEVFTGSPGKYVGLAETIRGFNLILSGEFDSLPEQAFYLVGKIDEATAKATNLEMEKVKEIILSTNSGQIGVLPNHAPIATAIDIEKNSDIDPQDAQQTLEIAEANLRKAEGKRQTIEANLALRRARTRVEALNTI
ncbi:unnamed protein product, partial [Brassica rapa]